MKLANPLRFLALAAVLCSSIAAQADTLTYVTPTGSKDGAGDLVNARATFTTGTDAITIVLSNLFSNPTDVGQNLSDLFFTVSTGQKTGTVSSSSGLERTIADDGSFTVGSTVDAGWVLSTSGSGLLLDVLAGTGHAGPAHTLIGPAGGATYTNANGSIAGNGPHNPFLFGSITFNLSVAGVTAGSSISSATFSFGTTAGDNVTGTRGPNPVPEPATWAIAAAMSLAGVFYYGRKQLVKVRPAGV
jgi:hypothetical protein